MIVSLAAAKVVDVAVSVPKNLSKAKYIVKRPETNVIIAFEKSFSDSTDFCITSAPYFTKASLLGLTEEVELTLNLMVSQITYSNSP